MHECISVLLFCIFSIFFSFLVAIISSSVPILAMASSLAKSTKVLIFSLLFSLYIYMSEVSKNTSMPMFKATNYGLISYDLMGGKYPLFTQQ